MMNATDTRHVFHHIAPAPYRYIGYAHETYQACPGAPIQVGGSCDHCGQGIKDTYRFRAVDGTVFKVGSTCVEKSGDKGLYSQIKRDANAVKRERKAKRDAMRIAAGVELLPTVRAELEAEPHPKGFNDRETGRALTLADWVDWMLANAGTAGRLRAVRVIEKQAKGKESK